MRKRVFKDAFKTRSAEKPLVWGWEKHRFSSQKKVLMGSWKTRDKVFCSPWWVILSSLACLPLVVLRYYSLNVPPICFFKTNISLGSCMIFRKKKNYPTEFESCKRLPWFAQHHPTIRRNMYETCSIMSSVSVYVRSTCYFWFHQKKRNNQPMYINKKQQTTAQYFPWTFW